MHEIRLGRRCMILLPERLAVRDGLRLCMLHVHVHVWWHVLYTGGMSCIPSTWWPGRPMSARRQAAAVRVDQQPLNIYDGRGLPHPLAADVLQVEGHPCRCRWHGDLLWSAARQCDIMHAHQSSMQGMENYTCAGTAYGTRQAQGSVTADLPLLTAR